MFSLEMPDELSYHLELASASHGLSKGEYTRLALQSALSAEPVVTPVRAREMFRLSQAIKRGKTTGNPVRERASASGVQPDHSKLVDA